MVSRLSLRSVSGQKFFFFTPVQRGLEATTSVVMALEMFSMLGNSLNASHLNQIFGKDTFARVWSAGARICIV